MRHLIGSLCIVVVSALTHSLASEPDAHFKTAVKQVQEAFGFPGMTAAYVFDTGQQGSAAAGWADRESHTPMEEHSRMLAASIGKSFVAATAVSLAMEGTLSLDRPVSHWLDKYPWFTRVPNHATITLRHLLTHTSGIPDHVYMPAFARELADSWQSPGNVFPPKRLIAFVLNQKALFPAGEGWAYSDTGYILAGLVIEEAAGESYFDLVRERFITPLALLDTAPADTRELKGLAAGYTSVDNRFQFPAKTLDEQGRLQWNPGLEWTGGGLVSTSRDLARWGSLLFSGRAMRGKYLPLLLESVPLKNATDSPRYGLGVAVSSRDGLGMVYGHAGWIPGYVSSLRYYPDIGIAVAFQINSDVEITASPDILDQIERRLIRSLTESGNVSLPRDTGKTGHNDGK